MVKLYKTLKRAILVGTVTTVFLKPQPLQSTPKFMLKLQKPKVERVLKRAKPPNTTNHQPLNEHKTNKSTPLWLKILLVSLGVGVTTASFWAMEEFKKNPELYIDDDF